MLVEPIAALKIESQTDYKADLIDSFGKAV
jgi:hypothetical protein